MAEQGVEPGSITWDQALLCFQRMFISIEVVLFLFPVTEKCLFL